MHRNNSDDPFKKLGEIKSVSILVVGAGGVGCEVIKNLLLCGFENLTIADMDTIDISNLNRQFLYNRNHVGRYKAEVACERALEVAPNCNVKSLVCNVLTLKPEDLSVYDVVLNDLDNIRARSHINYCCLHAGVPLIDSGSTGFSGQIVPIFPKLTKCYDCDSKPKTTSIPVCTIRQVPEKAEHCIAWARKLYELLFGTRNSDNILSDLQVPSIPSENRTPEATVKYIHDLYNFLFKTEIDNLRNIKHDWNDRPPPQPLEYPEVLGRKNKRRTHLQSDTLQGEKHQKVNGTTNFISKNHKSVRDKLKVCDVFELSLQFYESIHHIITQTPEIIGSATFSKDDPVCIQFISSAANLRMLNFHIATLSTWDVQSIAGSIIPAIAATNAIVAATQVLQLVHVLEFLRCHGKAATFATLCQSKCRLVWVQPSIMGSSLSYGNVSHPELLEPPIKKCTICQQDTIQIVLKDPMSWSLDKFVKVICSQHLGMHSVNIDCDMRNIFDCEEFADDPDYASKVCKGSIGDFGIKDLSILTITSSEDSNQQFEIQVKIDENLQDTRGFSIIGQIKNSGLSVV
ncbi:bifunctional THIF-type NAD-FAD binding fold/Ubiquitin-SUMO-activating enzyme ubiquitin-like domain/Ubiquitin activating enzyme [Babesia duncani]|uniref:SUMO-activating enzyme subunit n=1 Tax=Babesia duncani TaxID=323732 RepID=A0AAD9UPI5_9APIC|nr:bifunctional THIF-type NAD-FAD binding fold/Ubiquitin-SUMO-activating enzyme ubiquitin-like domain/Ubiquitin activating enzyme [Babesia duncani]